MIGKVNFNPQFQAYKPQQFQGKQAQFQGRQAQFQGTAKPPEFQGARKPAFGNENSAGAKSMPNNAAAPKLSVNQLIQQLFGKQKSNGLEQMNSLGKMLENLNTQQPGRKLNKLG